MEHSRTHHPFINDNCVILVNKLTLFGLNPYFVLSKWGAVISALHTTDSDLGFCPV